MLEKFRPATLAEQAAQSLRQSILKGEIRSPLPGEVQLAEHLQISRPTVRSALAILNKEGLISIAKGKRTRVRESLPRHRVRQRKVVVISPHPKHASAFINGAILQEIRFQLASRGIGWEEIYDAQLGGRHPEKILEEIDASYRGATYLLLLSSIHLQAWFQEHKRPVLILGSCHEGINLPSLDVDHRAVGWHVAGQMVKEGHRKLLLILPQVLGYGDRATEQGVIAYLEKVPGGAASLQTIRADTVSLEFRVTLERLMQRKDPPSACLATRVEHALSVIGTLPLFGMGVPRDLSLIAVNDNPIYQCTLPEVARYAVDWRSHARRATRMIQHLVDGVAVPSKPVMLMPQFFRGQTLGQAGEA